MDLDQQQLEPGFGFNYSNKYETWWQAAEAGEYVPKVIVNRRGMAEILEVSTQTIDNLIHKGAPVLRRGYPLQIDTAAYIQFYMAHKAGMTLQQYREWEVQELREMKERARVEALEQENQDLKQQLAALRRELVHAE